MVDGKISNRSWHVDGMRQGKRRPFSLLVGVALSEVSEPMCGNFTIFPKSHKLIHELILDNGCLRGIDDHLEWSLATSMYNPWGVTDGPQLPDLGPPKQLLLKPGDVVLAHPNLAHRGAPNLSPNIRYMVYFRLKSSNFASDEVERTWSENMYADLPNVSSWLASSEKS